MDGPPSDLRKRLATEASRIEEDTELFFKSQYKAADAYGRLHSWLSGVAAVLSAIAGGSQMKDAPAASIIGPYAPLLSLAAAALMAIVLFLKPGERSGIYKKAAVDIQALHDDARIFREVELSRTDISDDVLATGLRRLNERRTQLRKQAPLSPRWAYRAAKTALDRGEHRYRVDQDSGPTG
jgi:hypothetical protein